MHSAHNDYLGDPGMVNIVQTVDSLHSFLHMRRWAVGYLCCPAELVHVAFECLYHLKYLADTYRERYNTGRQHEEPSQLTSDIS